MYSPVVKIMQVKRLCPSAITIQVVRPLLAHLFYHTIPTLLTLPYSTEYYYILLKLFVVSLWRVKSNGHFPLCLSLALCSQPRFQVMYTPSEKGDK